MPSAIEQFESLPLDILLRILFRAVEGRLRTNDWIYATPFLRGVWEKYVKPFVAVPVGKTGWGYIRTPTWCAILENAALLGDDRTIGLVIEIAPSVYPYASFAAMEHCAGGLLSNRSRCHTEWIRKLSEMTVRKSVGIENATNMKRLYRACDAMISLGETELAQQVFVEHYPFPIRGWTLYKRSYDMYYTSCGSYVVIHPPPISCSNPMPPRCRW
jgi:hypothetical protein